MTTVTGSIDSAVDSVETTTTPDWVVDGFTELLDDVDSKAIADEWRLFPFLVVHPLCPRTCSFPDRKLAAWLDWLNEKYQYRRVNNRSSSRLFKYSNRE